MCVTMNDCPNVVALRMSGKLLEQVISSERSNEGERDPFIHQEERIQKSVNLQYITLGCLDDGTNKSSTKSLMFQVLSFLYFLWT